MLRAVAAAFVFASLLAPVRGEAAKFDVSPVRVELSAAQPTALVTIRNADKTPIRVQLRGHAWTQSSAGEMQLAPATDFSVYPALLQIDPGTERKVRVGATVKAGAIERCWRIFIEEMPSAVELADRSSVRVLTRVGIPVFLGPKAAAPKAEVGLKADGGKLAITLRNTGNVHVEPGSGRLLLLGAAGESVLEQELKFWYVLPEGDRIIEEAVAPDVCAKVRRAVVSFPIDKGEVTAELALPTGACGG